MHEYAAEFGFKTNDYTLAREWINKDFMIIESANEMSIDVILTTDYRSFFPLTQKLYLFCVLTYPEYFDHNAKHVFKYHHDKVIKQLSNRNQKSEEEE